jgi:flagellar protein FlgJ
MSIGIPSSRTAQIPFASQAPRLPLASAKSASTSTAADSAQPNDDIRKAAESFEAIILRQLLGSMRKAKLSDDVFGSSATENFREMADAKTADTMAGLRQFGIADMVERQLRSMNAAPAAGDAK